MKQKKKGGDKPRKTPLQVVEPVAEKSPQRITPREAAQEFRFRIDLIGRDFSHDPGMMRYRAALMMALAAIQEKYGIEEEGDM